MNFASTKSQNQFIPSIKAVSESLTTYGHDPIEFIFTDNPRADTLAIEAAIPSMRNNVVSVPNPTHLKQLVLLTTSNPIVVLSTTYQINTRFEAIIENMSDMSPVYAAVNMEWPVNMNTGIQGHVSLISMTLGDEIYLIPVSNI